MRIPPGRCPTHGIPRRDSFFLPSHSSSLGETAACGVLLPLGWEQRVESPRTIPHQVLPRSRFAGKRVHGFDAYFPHLRRKRLQPRSQTFASKTPKNALSGPPRQKCQDDTIRKPSSAWRAVPPRSVFFQHGLERIRRIERIGPMVDVRQKH